MSRWARRYSASYSPDTLAQTRALARVCLEPKLKLKLNLKRTAVQCRFESCVRHTRRSSPIGRGSSRHNPD